MGTPVVLADRVLVATTTTGTGTYAIGTAITGYLDPAGAGATTGARLAYVVVDSLTAPTAFEIGEGIYTAGSPGTLTRAQIRRNTAGGTSAINWGAGTKYLMLAPGAANLPTLDTDGALTAPALTLTGAATVGGALTVGTGMTLSAGVAALPAGTAAAPALKVGGQQNGLSAASANTLVASAGGTAIGTFSSTGLAVAGNVSWSSDQRLKADIRPARLGLKQALRILPVTFQRIGRGRRRELGVLAQAVQAAHPLAVTRDSEGHLAVSASGLDAILLGAIHDLAAELNALKARLQALERRRDA